jgi:hypothetical protein
VARKKCRGVISDLWSYRNQLLVLLKNSLAWAKVIARRRREDEGGNLNCQIA